MTKRRTASLLALMLSLLLLITGCTGADITSSVTDNNTEGSNPAVITPEPGDTSDAAATPEVPSGPSENPRVIVNKLIAYDKYLISGTCGEGAVITVEGGTDTVSFRSDAGCFMAVVPVGAWQTHSLSLTATEPGRTPSEAWTADVEGGKKGKSYITDYGDSAVVVGDAYQCFFSECIDDYTGTRIMSEKTASSLATNFKKKVEQIKAKVIVLVAPDPCTVYPEYVPAEFTPAEKTYRQQFNEALADSGATVIDLTETLTAHKNDELKIYQKTDSHWTQYGAYLGYRELMNVIAADFPDAAPRSESEITFENRMGFGGDMTYYLDVMDGEFEYWDVGSGQDYSAVSQYDLMPEYTCFASMNFPAPTDATLYWDNSCRSYFKEVERSHDVKNTVSEGNLPTAYIIRDSFSTQMYNMLNERFSYVTWESMWSYKVDTAEINEADPDYVIIICNERVLGDVSAQFSSSGRRGK